MCIQTRIQKILAEKEALDAQIIRLEKLETATTPVKNLLAELLADYAQEAPEDLAAVWEEVLAIGQSHNLSVQPWEFVNPALSLLKAELEKAQTEIAEQDRAWGELSDERDDLEATLAEVRSQIPTPTIRADYELATGNDASELSKAQCERQLEIWSKESITPELEKLYQEALPETDSEATLTNEEYAAAVEEELGLDDDGKDIPALTLWQPWATLIEQEVKRVETRSWATNYRGPIAIHAAKKPVAVSDYPHLFELVSYGCEFPFGAVVAIANLVNCVEMTEEFIAQQSETELKCGDWSPGRFAWILEIIRPVVPPIPATGGQKIWNWSGTSIEAELEHLEEFTLVLPQPLPDVTECEPEEVTDLIASILGSHGFFMPDMKVGDQYSEDEKYEDYQSWASYRQSHDRGVTGIGLYHEKFGFWDASTEMIGEDDPTFPEDFSDGDAMLTWVRSVIDKVVVISPVENLEVPGQLSLEFPDPTSEQIEEELSLDDDNELTKWFCKLEGKKWEVKVLNKFPDGTVSFLFKTNLEGFTQQATLAELEECNYSITACADKILASKFLSKTAPGQTELQKTETDFEAMGFNIKVYPQYAGEDNLVGATFRFSNSEHTLIFAQSLLKTEMGELPYRVVAEQLIVNYQAKESARLEKIANPYATEEDKFIELVKLSPAVGYIKRRDNGEMLSAYAAFANRDAAGEKTATLAKSRSKKWAEYLHGTFESCGWKVEEPRKINRMVAELGARQQFAYEIKITGKFSIGQLQKLAEEDFSLLPGEIAATETVATRPLTPASTQIYRVKVNNYDLATGTEEEMRSRFEEELKILGGSQVSVKLLTGSEVVESYSVRDFEFTQIKDADAINPEYQVTHLPSQKTFKVYKNLGLEGYPIGMSGWTNTLYPYTPGFTQRVAAAADAIRRSLKAQNAAE